MEDRFSYYQSETRRGIRGKAPADRFGIRELQRRLSDGALRIIARGVKEDNIQSAA
jgi:hypothetical protein